MIIVLWFFHIFLKNISPPWKFLLLKKFHDIANEDSSEGLNESKNASVAANNVFLRGRVSVCVSNVYDVDSWDRWEHKFVSVHTHSRVLVLFTCCHLDFSSSSESEYSRLFERWCDVRDELLTQSSHAANSDWICLERLEMHMWASCYAIQILFHSQTMSVYLNLYC